MVELFKLQGFCNFGKMIQFFRNIVMLVIYTHFEGFKKWNRVVHRSVESLCRIPSRNKSDGDAIVPCPMRYQRYPLHLAAGAGFEEIARELLCSGADTEARDTCV